jgi:alanyl-tRNA synthetase
VAGLVEKADRATLERLVDTVREELRSGVVVLGTADNGRVQLMAGVTRDLTDRLKAGALLNEVARLVGGKAGGPPNFAQGGGSEPAKLPEALERTRTIVARLLAESGQR